MRVLTVCGAGVGTSLMEKMFAEAILNDAGVDAQVDNADISSATPNDYDVVITTSMFAEMLPATNAQVIIHDNIMDQTGLKQKLLAALAQED
ncbi:PTS sugar transporter subunit IIB [Lacticaseibacillus suibinensis]|uniref:PTS sugar transporter subunit IIB n=1 Tax=Lacticaseibacillus suibinensis TaxID=2486011 RepID=UPI000F773F93|nr:PTS sugar transporter subunit IIB [Lacticaseibacillus suibinensis]